MEMFLFTQVLRIHLYVTASPILNRRFSRSQLSFFSVCFVLSLQVGIWPTQPYLGIPLTFPLQARAATQPPRSLEWFLVRDELFYIVIRGYLTVGVALKTFVEDV